MPDGLGSCEMVADAEGVPVPLGVAELVPVAAWDDVCEGACVTLCDSEGLPDVVELDDGDSDCELVETCEELCVPLVLAVAVIDAD